MATGILIPARYGSTRLPGKPLIEILGKPAIQHVYEACSALELQTWVVTDDQRIADAVGAENALIVPNDCANGTERCALALNQVPPTVDTICIVAGDQLTASSADVQTLIDAAQIGQLWTAVSPQKEHAVTTCEVRRGIITEFNRGTNLPYAALGMYVYPRNMLFDYFAEWPTWGTERLLGIELTRAYFNHVSIYAAKVDTPGLDLNTAEDVALIEAWYTSSAS